MNDSQLRLLLIALLIAGILLLILIISAMPTNASTETNISNYIPVNNELSMVVFYKEIYNASGTLINTTYRYYHIPFILYIILIIPIIWIASRFIIEFLIRLRKK